MHIGRTVEGAVVDAATDAQACLFGADEALELAQDQGDVMDRFQEIAYALLRRISEDSGDPISRNQAAECLRLFARAEHVEIVIEDNVDLGQDEIHGAGGHVSHVIEIAETGLAARHAAAVDRRAQSA